VERKPTDARVAVFAPVTIRTITLEQAADGQDEVHVHAGGQGVWQARMIATLGRDVAPERGGRRRERDPARLGQRPA